MNLAKKHWFLVAMITSIFTAYFFPWIGASQGPLKPEWSVKVFAVCLIFFLSGWTHNKSRRIAHLPISMEAALFCANLEPHVDANSCPFDGSLLANI